MTALHCGHERQLSLHAVVDCCQKQQVNSHEVCAVHVVNDTVVVSLDYDLMLDNNLKEYESIGVECQQQQHLYKFLVR